MNWNSIMQQSDKVREALNCKSCLEWHKYCHAECCTQLRFQIPKGYDRKKLVRGNKVTFSYPYILSHQNIIYYRYRGIKLIRNQVTFTLKEFKIEGDAMTLYNRCSELTRGLKCRLHPDRKPIICKELTINNLDDKRFYITPNCLYKYQRIGGMK